MMIGVLGGGQLGRMLALAGYPLGLHFRFLDAVADAPAGQVGELVVGPSFEDRATLERFARGLDVVTYEFENVPVGAARWLADHLDGRVYPPPGALEAAQDRLAEKDLFRRLGVPTPAYAPVGSLDELHAAVGEGGAVGLPAVLKTRRLGYDGKGQMVLHEAGSVERGWAGLGEDERGGSVPLIVEQFVPFERELSILGVRGRDGETAFYPLVENRHMGGILRVSRAPAPDTSPRLQKQAEGYARDVMAALEYVGVLAVEFFQWQGRLLANEMAPRVHNSGHWTIEGAVASQFENHVRATAGWALGSTEAAGYSVMINLIGGLPGGEGAVGSILRIPGAHLHLYGKQARAGRKVGHVTVRADERRTAEARADQVGRIIEPEGA